MRRNRGRPVVARMSKPRDNAHSPEGEKEITMASLKDAKVLVYCDAVSSELKNMEKRIDVVRNELKKIAGMANEPAKDQRVAELTKDLLQLTEGVGMKLNAVAKECSFDYRHMLD